VTKLVTEEARPFTVEETLIPATCALIVRTVCGTEAEEEIKKVPLLNNTVDEYISDISVNIEKTVYNKIQECNIFAIVDDSIDLGGKAQLLVFSQFTEDEKIIEQFLCLKALEETTIGKDILFFFFLINTFTDWFFKFFLSNAVLKLLTVESLNLDMKCVFTYPEFSM
jgi:hypothetical protein